VSSHAADVAFSLVEVGLPAVIASINANHAGSAVVVEACEANIAATGSSAFEPSVDVADVMTVVVACETEATAETIERLEGCVQQYASHVGKLDAAASVVAIGALSRSLGVLSSSSEASAQAVVATVFDGISRVVGTMEYVWR
jgi:spore coat polysaccharide biosynthesis predicted glycosyltransferase SpsG